MSNCVTASLLDIHFGAGFVRTKESVHLQILVPNPYRFVVCFCSMLFINFSARVKPSLLWRNVKMCLIHWLCINPKGKKRIHCLCAFSPS